MSSPSGQPPVLPQKPFRGIEPFRFADQQVFFARDEEIQRLFRATAVYRGVLVYGDQGCGKSSLISAGLIPLAQRENFAPHRLRVRPGPDREIVVERISESPDGGPPYLLSIFTDAPEPPERMELSVDEMVRKLAPYRIRSLGERIALRLRQPSDALSSYLAGRTTERTRELIGRHDEFRAPSAELQQAISDDIRSLLADADFYAPERFSGISLSAETHALAEPILSRQADSTDAGERMVLNQRLLEEAFPPEPPPRPQTPLLIFDQFEEFVTLFEIAPRGDEIRIARVAQNRILDTLVELLRDGALAIKLMFVFREDYLAKLNKLFVRCPELPDQYLRLTPPGPEKLRDIIRGPFVKFPGAFGREISETLETRLASAIEAKSEGSLITLSEVQIVCLRLWQSSDPDRLFEEKGGEQSGIQRLLEDYLEDAIGSFHEQLRHPAVALLSSLLTSLNTRNIVEREDLIRRVMDEEVDSELVGEALDELVRARLVRQELRHHDRFYEIVSEFLIPWIREKRQARETEAKLDKARAEAEKQSAEEVRRARHEAENLLEFTIFDLRDTFENDLRALIALRRILVVIGAGVSIEATKNAKAASLPGLLKLGAARCRELNPGLDEAWQKRLVGQIESGDLDDTLSTAEQISRKLKAHAGGEFRRFLRETVGRLELRDPAALEALRSLQVPLATTNYDDLLERVTKLPPVTWRNQPRVLEFLHGDRQAILHLHGYWEDPESVVLGIRSYEEVRQDSHTQAVIRVLAMTQSLLFVGCGEGLSDPNFGPFLSWLREVNTSNPQRHYRLALWKDVVELQKQHALQERIFVLSYGDKHEDLVPFLHSLAPPSWAVLPGPARAAVTTAPELSTPGSKTEPSTPKIELPMLVVDARSRGDYPTLTEALEAAKPGTRILVRPGLYNEGVVIDKPVEVVGEGSLGEVVIEARGKDTILYKANMGRIANLTLRQAGGGEWHCVDIAQGRLNLEECDITGQGPAGVAIHAGADPWLRCNRIHDCKQGGIFVYEGGQGTLEDNDIFVNRLAGVAIKTGGNVTLRRNRIHDGARDGVFVWEDAQGTLEDNDIFANSLPGVVVGKGANVIMRRNRIYGGWREGVYVQENGQATLENNEITANGLAGVEIKTGGNAILRRNRISGNGSAAIRVYAEGRGIIEDNDLRGNAGGAWDVSRDCEANVKRERNRE